MGLHSITDSIRCILFHIFIYKFSSHKSYSTVCMRYQLATRLIRSSTFQTETRFPTFVYNFVANPRKLQKLLSPTHVDNFCSVETRLYALYIKWRFKADLILVGEERLEGTMCTCYSGLPLDVQLTIGTWLCSYVRSGVAEGGVSPTGPEWCWAAIRRLRLHRSSWQLPLDAPPPEDEPTDLFSIAYALLSSSWGHCIPVVRFFLFIAIDNIKIYTHDFRHSMEFVATYCYFHISTVVSFQM